MPKYFASVLGCMIVSATLIDPFVCADVFLVKCIRTYLDFSNRAPCRCRHCSDFLRSRSSCFAFAAAVVFCAPYNISSMKPSPSCFLLGMSRRSLLYRMYSIGDSGDPCGIPVRVGMGLVVVPLNRIWVVLLLRKESIHCVISTGILHL